MQQRRSWTVPAIATVVAVAVPATIAMLVGGMQPAAASSQSAPVATTLPATISPSTLPAPISPSAAPSTLPATLPPQPIATPSTLPATLSPEDVKALEARTSGQTYTVTFAARWCPEYSSVFANRARNNIMESLQDLGPNTNYGDGQSISPSKEDEAPQSACTPLVGWDFQLGTGINGKTPGTNLSRVANPGAIVTTKPSVDELSPAGNDTGRSIAGAVTLELTPQQVNDAANRQLWVQGGTAAQPLGPNAGQYGFAALRCANDNLNGDNVEYVNFKSQDRHVFCYYYAVKPPPKAGIIVIKKRVPDLTAPDVSFTFGGNTSFNPDGAFSLRKGQQIEFVRGASTDTGFDWRVTEDVPADWQLGISCASAKGTSDTSEVGSNGIDITLAAGDTVTCEFTNVPNPPPGRLELGKSTRGGSGTFGFDVVNPGGATIDTPTVTVPEGSITRIGTYDITKSGSFTVKETLPTGPQGAWELTSVRCEGASGTVVDERTARIDVTVGGRSGSSCILVNTFTPNAASLTVRSRTVGAAGGDSNYEISPRPIADQAQPEVRYQRADNADADTFVNAVPISTPADETSALDPGSYLIEGFGPVTTALGSWTLADVSCAGGTVTARSAAAGRVTVTLPPRGAVTCDFSWTLERPVTLDVIKTGTESGGSRTSDVLVVVACTDGAEGSLTVRPDEALPARLTPSLQFVGSTVCRATEVAPGGNPVDTTWTVSGPEGTRSGTGSYVDVKINQPNNPGATYTVTFANAYRAGTPTPTPTTPAPTEPPTPGGELPQVPIDPPSLPEVIDPETPNVILPGEVDTNAGQAARVSVRCTPLTRANTAGAPFGDVRLCTVTRDQNGRVTLRVNVRPVTVTLTLQAPPTGKYAGFVRTKTWVVR